MATTTQSQSGSVTSTGGKNAIKTADCRAMDPVEQATTLGNLLAAMDADPRSKIDNFKKTLINKSAVEKAAGGAISESEYRLVLLAMLRQVGRLYLSTVGHTDGKVATGVNLDGSDGTVESNIQRQSAFRKGTL